MKKKIEIDFTASMGLPRPCVKNLKLLRISHTGVYVCARPNERKHTHSHFSSALQFFSCISAEKKHKIIHISFHIVVWYCFAQIILTYCNTFLLPICYNHLSTTTTTTIATKATEKKIRRFQKHTHHIFAAISVFIQI